MPYLLIQFAAIETFQFLNGAIKIATNKFAGDVPAAFQFLNGAIKM